jgi:hypothetical protein
VGDLQSIETIETSVSPFSSSPVPTTRNYPFKLETNSASSVCQCSLIPSKYNYILLLLLPPPLPTRYSVYISIGEKGGCYRSCIDDFPSAGRPAAGGLCVLLLAALNKNEYNQRGRERENKRKERVCVWIESIGVLGQQPDCVCMCVCECRVKTGQ